MGTIIAVIYATISGIIATISVINVHIGSAFYDVENWKKAIVFIVSMVAWPIVVIVAIVDGIIDRIKDR